VVTDQPRPDAGRADPLVALADIECALAAAEDSAIETQLIERLAGYDQVLLRLAPHVDAGEWGWVSEWCAILERCCEVIYGWLDRSAQFGAGKSDARQIEQ
jgi:hypothetical protein